MPRQKDKLEKHQTILEVVRSCHIWNTLRTFGLPQLPPQKTNRLFSYYTLFFVHQLVAIFVFLTFGVRQVACTLGLREKTGACYTCK